MGGTSASYFDTITGGSGNDTYYVDFNGINKTLKLVLDATGGGSLVNASSPTTKYAVLSGIENVTLYTGLGNDTINLGAVVHGDQTIYTHDGNDTITVAEGHHYLDGGNGTDTAVVNFSSSTTALSGLAQFGNSTLADKAGLNTVTFANMEVFDITGGSGNDRIMTYGYDDTLRGGAATTSCTAAVAMTSCTTVTAAMCSITPTTGRGLTRSWTPQVETSSNSTAPLTTHGEQSTPAMAVLLLTLKLRWRQRLMVTPICTSAPTEPQAPTSR